MNISTCYAHFGGQNRFIAQASARAFRGARWIDLPIARVDAVIEVKKKRDKQKLRRSLDELPALAREAPSANSNLVPAVIEAVKGYATVGEIGDAFRKAWGEFREPAIF